MIPMATITIIVNNTNIQKEGCLLEKNVPGWKYFQKDHKRNTKVKLKNNQNNQTLCKERRWNNMSGR